MIRAGLLLTLVLAVPAAAQDRAPVPFVGCASDGQMGPVEAPDGKGQSPTAPAAVAGRLAYYASGDLAVLAPRGWHCFGLYGSNGAGLYVTPEPHGEALFDLPAPLTGPIVQVHFSYSGTSGRFEVARVIARLFPARKAFADAVLAEDTVSEGIVFGPFRTDRTSLLNDHEARFETPAGQDGMGIGGRMAPGRDPVLGYAGLTADEDLLWVGARLPASERDLATAIVADVRAGS
ncbi:MAG: hypothetical protein Q7T61_11015 [Caulobacter sp.]|nr:hypothetical protein [Caulobacter sp.]